MSGDRRLAISSLLNTDDNSHQPFSPLEALVHAATEERRRLSNPLPNQYHPHAYEEDPRFHRQPPIEYEHERGRPLQQQHVQQVQQQQQQQQQRLEEQQRAQLLQRQQDYLRSHPQPRIEERRPFDPIERQREDPVRQVDLVRQHQDRLHPDFERQLQERQQQDRLRHLELERQQIERIREEERLREERQREYDRHEDLRLRQQRELERQREMELQRREQELQRIQHQQRRMSDPHRPATAHPPSISHLISHSPPPSAHLKLSASPISPDPHAPFSQPDDIRPNKKPRFSQSPTRPISDDKDRIARERDRMFVGEIGYGRVDSPPSLPPPPPRRPGSGQGSIRKPALADLLVDRDRPKPEAHRVVSPLGRRSPPGSQIGRAKAARKSDELLRDIPKPKEELDIKPPARHRSSTIDDARPFLEEPAPKRKEPHPAPRRTSTVDDPRPFLQEPAPKRKDPVPPAPRRGSIVDDPRPQLEESLPKRREILSPPPAKPHPSKSKPHQDDAHEWFLQQLSEPTPPPRPDPSRSVTPSVASTSRPAPAPRSLSLITAVYTLEQELEALVSNPASSSTVRKHEQEEQEASRVRAAEMDLDVDQAVAELVAETEEQVQIKREPSQVDMEVDVEDELLSLVNDLTPSSSALPGSSRRTGPPQSTASISPTTKQAPPLQLPDTNQASPSSAVTPSSATLVSPTVPRQPSVKPQSDRDSMPPPAHASKKPAATDHATAEPASKKKKKETAAKAEAKGKASSTKSASAAANAPSGGKARSKAAPKAKKKDAAGDASPIPPASTPPTKAKAPKKGTAPSTSASRSRSASVMPGASADNEALSKADKAEEEDDSDGANEDDKLYCVCKTKYDEDRFMIACDKCDEWYHTQCVNMPDLEVDLVDQFICPPCIEKHPSLNLRTTYKQRCLWGLRHPDPNSNKACHKAARGAFSKYCSDECGVKYMQSLIDNWTKKGGKPDKLWDSVKNAEKREGVVVCAPEVEDKKPCNGVMSSSPKVEEGVPVKQEEDQKPPVKPRIVQPLKSKMEKESERLTGLLDDVIKLREEIKKGMEIVVWRERLLQLASERAEQLGQCGWDQRLCLDDEEWAEVGAGALESYEESKAEGAKPEGEMEVDNAEEQWWCDENQVCSRHTGWQAVRYKDVCKEKEKKEQALSKLTTREREIRKRIDALLDPQNDNANDTNPSTTITNTTTTIPLKSSNAKLANGHTKASKAAHASGEAPKKGKKRKVPAS